VVMACCLTNLHGIWVLDSCSVASATGSKMPN
jgi:hypothetical protein